jgi:hypothetical protein
MESAAQTSLGLPDLPGIESGWELLQLDAPDAPKRFTADQIAKNQEKLNAVVRALGEGLGVRQIARAFGISTNTVLKVSQRFGAEVETQKQSLGRDFLDVARLAVERMRDEMDSMPRQSLPIIAGIGIERGQLLTGAPTARVEHNHALQVLSVADYIDSLPAASSVEVAGNAAPKEAARAALEGGPALTGVVEVDSQSTDLPTSSEVSLPKWADSGRDGDKKHGPIRPDSTQLRPGAARERAQSGGRGGDAPMQGGYTSSDGSNHK